MILAQLKAYSSLIIGGVVMVALGSALWVSYSKGYDSADSKWQDRWDKFVAEQIELNFNAEVEIRSRETKWQTKFDEASKDAQQKINDLEADRDAAIVSRDGLRDEARAYANRAKRCAQSSSATGERETTEAPAMVLAELFASADKRAGELAEAVDRARIAGLACQNAYMSIKKTPSD